MPDFQRCRGRLAEHSLCSFGNTNASFSALVEYRLPTSKFVCPARMQVFRFALKKYMSFGQELLYVFSSRRALIANAFKSFSRPLRF